MIVSSPSHSNPPTPIPVQIRGMGGLRLSETNASAPSGFPTSAAPPPHQPPPALALLAAPFPTSNADPSSTTTTTIIKANSRLGSSTSTASATAAAAMTNRLSRFLRYCTGRSPTTTEITSEEENSSDVVGAAIDDTSMTSTTRRSTATNHASTAEKAKLGGTMSVGRAEEGRFRSRGGTDSSEVEKVPEEVFYSYKVLIEYKEGGEGQRPTVRLSSIDQPSVPPVTDLSNGTPTVKEPPVPPPSTGWSLRRGNRKQRSAPAPGGSIPDIVLNASGSTNSEGQRQMSMSERDGETKSAARSAAAIAAMREEHLRKIEKDRRKNERKQESKAAKTLSAILFAFIVTWTPYIVIVCWESFYPLTIPEVLFTISYCLCYVNSTINPLCYALCNARFRMTFLRILKCKQCKKRPSSATAALLKGGGGSGREGGQLFRHAYLRRT